MKKMTKNLFMILLVSLFFSCKTMEAPQAVYPIPQPKQVEWQKMETYAFIHFGLNTFNDREWGYGDSDPKTFNPVKLDCEQWAKTLVAAGMKGVILTAKHHDGFCLWPTKFNEYNITKTPYKNGKGDIVGELSAACKKYGLKFAVYLSPWDRNHSEYARPEYVEYFYNQLHELLSTYGDVFEVWFDGANGGDGWYGGTKEHRTIDNKTYYQMHRAYAMVDSLQPNAVIFGDGGPGCRWVGNERGYAGATNWSFLRKGEVHAGYDKHYELQYGHPNGNEWVAAECDVSIRPGWFYHPEEDSMVKSVDHLTDLYYRSVGHNATLLLNFPVDRNGLINPVDSAHAVDFHNRIKEELSLNIFANAKVKVSNERGGKFSAKAITDGKYDTYWATNDGVNSATVEFDLKKMSNVNRILLQEYIPLGQRVQAFTVEYYHNGSWIPVKLMEETTTVGYKRILRFNTVNTNKLRVLFTKSRASLCINNIEAFYVENSKDYVEDANKIESKSFTIINASADESAKAYDRDIKSEYQLDGDEVICDLGTEKLINSFSYLPSQHKQKRGLISNYEIYVSSSKGERGNKVAGGEFSNIKNNPIMQTVYFTPVNARFVTLKVVKTVSSGEKAVIAEIGIR